MSSTPDVTIILQSITCLNRSEAGKDELYFNYQIDGGPVERYPGFVNMKEGSVWEVNAPFSYQETLKITLWDNDSPSKDDNLGSHVYSRENASESLNLTYNQPNGHGAKYQVYTVPG